MAMDAVIRNYKINNIKIQNFEENINSEGGLGLNSQTRHSVWLLFQLTITQNFSSSLGYSLSVCLFFALLNRLVEGIFVGLRMGVGGTESIEYLSFHHGALSFHHGGFLQRIKRNKIVTKIATHHGENDCGAEKP